MKKLFDRYGRSITYLRISLTKRCNLKCIYCYPRRRKETRDANPLSREEIRKIAEESSLLGISKIRLTGGEPLLRKDVINIVKDIASNPGIKELCLTTNGILLKKYASRLKKAGLTRVNVSLDTLQREIYKKITGKDKLNDVLMGIRAAQKAGLSVKINFLCLNGTNESEKGQILKFCRGNSLQLQFIKRIHFPSGKDTKISSSYDRPPDCKTCNKIRLTSEGLLLPCLFSPDAVDLRKHKDIRAAIKKVVACKPKDGFKPISNRYMIDIGG